MTYIYVGGGAFVPGVPARDLSDTEWEALPKILSEAAKGLYRKKAETARQMNKPAVPAARAAKKKNEKGDSDNG